MNPSAYELPRIDARTAENLDLIGGRLGSGRFDLGGGCWRFSLAPLAGGVPWPSNPFHIAMEWGGGQLHLLAARAALALLYAHQFPNAPVDVLPEPLVLASLQLAWAELTDRLEQLGGRRVRLTAAARAEPNALDSAPFRFSLSLDSERAQDGIEGVIASDAPGLALLALLARRQPSKVRASDPDVPVAVRLELAEMQLGMSALRALAVNDLLVPDTVIDLATPSLWLRADSRRRARAKLEAHSLTIESVLQEDRPMPPVPKPKRDPQTAASRESHNSVSRDPHSPAAADVQAVSRGDRYDSVAAVDDIEIPISFDLGERILRVGELAALQPGQVLPLDTPSERLVAIRVNGYLIGRGELVRVDERVAVRVLQLAGPESSRSLS